MTKKYYTVELENGAEIMEMDSNGEYVAKRFATKKDIMEYLADDETYTFKREGNTILRKEAGEVIGELAIVEHN